MAEHQQRCADRDGFACAQKAVSDHAADHGDEVHKRRVGAVQRLGAVLGKEKMLRQVDHQQRAHAVEGEALPHLGEEQGDEAARMAKKRLLGAVAGGLICHVVSPRG
jgi:hypothetical protein